MKNQNKDDKDLAKLMAGQLNTTEGVIIKDGSLTTYASFVGDYQMVYDLLCGIERLKDGTLEVIKVKHGTRV